LPIESSGSVHEGNGPLHVAAYPQFLKNPPQSSLVIGARAAPTPLPSSSTLPAPRERNLPLTLLHTLSIRLKSGLYGGR